MSNIFSNLRWGILPLVLVTTTAMAMSTPASAMSTVNFSDSNLTHQEIKESLDNLKREHNSILNSDPRSSIEKALSPAPSIPSNPADGVNIGDINISLPKSDLASSSIPLSEGAFTYPAEGDSANTVIASSGAVQMLTTIANRSADQNYSYELSLSPGQYLQATEDGGAAVFDASGQMHLKVAKPWAKDSNGMDIPTHYVVDGNTLTQIVEHTSVPNAAYPVVADPFWLAPWAIRCLFGIGVNTITISRIMSFGSPEAILADVGYAGLRCIMGR